MSLSLVALGSYGQTVSIEEEEGDDLLQNFAFEKAISKYKMAYANDSGNTVITRKIADAYRRTGDLAASAEWYEKTLASDQSREEDLLYYAEALKTLEKYEESLVWYEKYNKLQPKDERAEKYLVNTTFYEELTEDSVMFVVKKLDFNNRKPAFGVTKYEEKLVFSATGLEGQKNNKTNPWNELPYLDVYQANLDDQNEAIDIEPIVEINSKYNDGPAHYDEVSKTMFVTRNNMKRGKPVKDKTGSVNLKIYTSKNVEGKWSEMNELPFNSDDYSTGHPSISADGNALYFASNRPGGEGGTDIYISERVNDTWSRPENMGKIINTKGNELFPYIDDNNILYFSSTGHLGLGGLDVFKIDLDSLKTTIPENIGYPINSPKDDFSFMFEEIDRSGYFCSNRDKGYSDDIFYFEINNLMNKIYAGRIESSLPDKSLAGNKLIVRNLDTGEEQTLILDENGEFEFDVEPGATYELAYQKEDVEEIIAVKTVEEVIAEEYENLGIFTIHERLAVNVYDDGNEIEINDALYKRFGEDGKFVSEQGDTLTNIEMMDFLSRNLDGNDIELNNDLYQLNDDDESYSLENGESVENTELEQLLISQIFANPLEIDDTSALAEINPDENDLMEADLWKSDLMDLELQDMTALEWVNMALEDENLTEEERLELEALKDSDLGEITATDWLGTYANDEEKAKDLSAVERKALGFLDDDMLLGYSNMTALEWVEKKLEDENLSEEERLELEALQNSDLAKISAKDWLATYANDPAKTTNLSDIERKALGIEDLPANNAAIEAAMTEATAAVAEDKVSAVEPLTIENIEDYVLNSKAELKEVLEVKRIENIYFDFDKSSIRKDARNTLDEIAAILIANPEVSMYVNAHTDTRGTNVYNDFLSENRAASVRTYLSQRGVQDGRLSLSWFGEDQLANECTDNIKCDEDAHQLNRRATFALAGDISESTRSTVSSSDTPPVSNDGQPSNESSVAENSSETGSEDEALADLGLDIIYFNFDKDNIREDARTILDALAAKMLSNNKSVVIHAHTDSRGSNTYNDVLSERRANSTLAYLAAKGIDTSRLEISWSGENSLTNPCTNGAKCSANQHQLNRRASLAWK